MNDINKTNPKKKPYKMNLFSFDWLRKQSQSKELVTLITYFTMA